MRTFGIIFCIWHLIGIFIICISGMSNDFVDYLEPKRIYKKFKVNVFGCIVLTIFFNLLEPVLTLMYWFYKICTVGRT